MEECLFCKIINKQIPAKTVYEDEKVLVFLDINPVSDGHLLIIPKKHVKNVLELPKDLVVDMVEIIQTKIYPLLKDKLQIDGMTVIQNNEYGQEVPHYHIHIIPRYQEDGIKTVRKQQLLSIDEIEKKLTS